MINTNTLLVSLFSPAQIVAMVLVAVLLALLISLNLYMMYLNHKRGDNAMRLWINLPRSVRERM